MNEDWDNEGQRAFPRNREQVAAVAPSFRPLGQLASSLDLTKLARYEPSTETRDHYGDKYEQVVMSKTGPHRRGRWVLLEDVEKLIKGEL